MKTMTFVGSGAAFTMNNRQSNILIESKAGKKMLLDAGTDIRHSLSRIGSSHLEVDAVYISHLHGDHCGGLEWLALMCYFDPLYNGQPKLFTSTSLKQRLWKNVLSGGLETLQVGQATLSTFFGVNPIKKNGSFVWEGSKFKLIQTIHVVNGSAFENSYGLMFDTDVGKIFFTSDTQYAPAQMNDFYNTADYIFQDAETMPFKSGVHAHYSDLKGLPDEVKNKMWLYHYNDGELPDAVGDGFKGFVQLGQVFDFTDVNTFN